MSECEKTHCTVANLVTLSAAEGSAAEGSAAEGSAAVKRFACFCTRIFSCRTYERNEETVSQRNIIKILIFLIAPVACGTFAGLYIAFLQDLPQIRSLETFKPPAVTRIYSADNVILAEFYAEKRDPVSLALIPRYLISAILATEDRNFYHHSGIDLKGILRAAIHNIRAKKFKEGASTITQQLAKTLFLTPRKTPERKIREAVLAFQLERRYTKDEILEFYLNQIYFGTGAYGVAAAARVFFGKSVNDLNLAECALIAAMPRSPSRYSPTVNRPLALERRNIVLRQMRNTGIITESAYRSAANTRISLAEQRKNARHAPYFTEYVKDFLEEFLEADLLYRGGFTVRTSLDFEMQQTAEQVAAARLSELEEKLRQKGIKAPDLECELISLDVESGAVLALAGIRNPHKSRSLPPKQEIYREQDKNSPVNVRKPPGSVFQTFIYAKAVEQGFSPNMMILDAPVIFKKAKDGKDWRPRNVSGAYHGEISLRKAFVLSENIPVIKLTEMLGPASVAHFGHSLGIESDLSADLSLGLGTSEVTLSELTAAYSVFPNKGKRIKPFGIIQIADGSGRVLCQTVPDKRMVMSRGAAALMTDMLKEAMTETDERKIKIRQPLAGKGGSATDGNDSFFIGFSPSVTTGVRVGQDPASSGKGKISSRTAFSIWADYMEKVLENKESQDFDIPPE